MANAINNTQFNPAHFTNSLILKEEEEVFSLTPADMDPTPTDDTTTLSQPTVQTPTNPEAQVLQSPRRLKDRKIKQLSSQQESPVEKIVRRITEESPETLNSFPNSDNNKKLEQAVQRAFDTLTKFQQQNTYFPQPLETEDFGIIAASAEKGYIITTKDPIKSGRFNDFFKLVQVEKNENRYEITAKAGRLCSEDGYVKFKQLNLKIVDTNLSNVMPLEFVWEMDNFLFQVNPLYTGDILTLSKQENWTFDKTLNVMIEALNGIFEMHSLNFVHRDLTPNNIFIKQNNVVIGDLDSSFKMGEKLPNDIEINSGGIFADRAHVPSPRTDMYSFGGCLIALFERLIPKISTIVTNEVEFLQNYKQLNSKERMLCRLIQALRSKYPAARPTAKAARETLIKISRSE